MCMHPLTGRPSRISPATVGLKWLRQTINFTRWISQPALIMWFAISDRTTSSVFAAGSRMTPRLVLVRSTVFNSDDRTWTYEVLFVSRDGAITRTGAIDHVSAVSRLVPRHSDLYFTRALNGIENLCAYSLATRRIRQVSENSQRGVTFGGVSPFGDDQVIGIRQEQTRDIHLLDTRPRGRRGGG